MPIGRRKVEVLYPHCAGLDVHKDSVVACARLQEGAVTQQEVETFGTTTTALIALADWLKERKVTHVAMEATGIYWRPVWHVLEEDYTLVLAKLGRSEARCWHFGQSVSPLRPPNRACDFHRTRLSMTTGTTVFRTMPTP